jgi:hypothetical protein
MRDIEKIKGLLRNLEFRAFDQYLSDMLSALGIPSTTIARLIDHASRDSFRDPLCVYRRAIIVKSNDSVREVDASRIEREVGLSTVASFRVLIVIGEKAVLCKDLMTGDVRLASPDQLAEHIHILLPLIYGSSACKDIELATDFAELVGSLLTQLSLDENNSSYGIERLIKFLFALMYVSFGTSLLEDNSVVDLMHLATASTERDSTAIVQALLDAILAGRIESDSYGGLPSLPFDGQEVAEVPRISEESFELVAQVLCCDLTDIDAEVLGSLIYKFTDDEGGSTLYGHQASYQNVARVLNSLFAEDIERRIEDIKGSPEELKDLRAELLDLTFFDPTDGPGSFLVAAMSRTMALLASIDDILSLSPEPNEVALDHFKGIASNSISRDLARMSLWVTYLQYMRAFGGVPPESLLTTYDSVAITLGDQLSLNWGEECPDSGTTLIVGSPTFKGKKNMSPEEKGRMNAVFGTSRSGDADFSSCWLYLAAK